EIYSLLGPSGCGKTTLLRIIIGCLRPQSGTVQVLGERPGPALNHQIGYMPQELGLNPFLPIRETFYYFARVNHVKNEQFIRERIDNYLAILGLKDAKQRVSQLSIGQKRLLSLGVILISKPRLLLLDEPTVGIDSMIRQKIWNHLRQLSREEGATIVLTTHYIEEAKESGQVSFLRNGHLLDEGSPNSLLKKFECQTLEEAFFRLCTIEIDRKNSTPIERSKTWNSRMIKNEYRCSKQFVNWDHLHALFCRDYFFFTHNLHFFLFYVLIPMATLFLAKTLLSHGMRSIPVAIHNSDHQSDIDFHLSDLFIQEFNTSAVAISVYGSEYEAERSVELGQNHMAISFRSNFSRLFVDRYVVQQNANNDLGDSSIHLYYDYTDIPSILALNNSILIALKRTIQKYCAIHELNARAFSVPIQVQEVVYGRPDSNIALSFLFPSALIQSQFTINIAKSALELVYLADYGCMNRDLIQGVRPFELMLQFILSSLICLLMIFISTVLDFPLFDDFLSPFTIITTISVQGMATGVLLAILIPNKVTVLFFTCAMILTMGFTSGAFWPTETWPIFWQQLSQLHPWTLPMKSLSSAMFRGFYNHQNNVFNGQLIGVFYCFLFILAATIVFHYKNRRFK
ncbi:hypothetical protein BLA29_003416, partial [Euroglyphus maynei]